jgi:flagellar hook-basal body complex protein FliE
MAIVKCPKCEQEISDKAEKCVHCGGAIFKKDYKARIKAVIAVIIIAILVCVVGGIGYKKYSAYKAEQQYLMAYNDYIEYLEKVHKLMIEGAGDSESLCILALKVWYNAVCGVDSNETDKYTKDQGRFVNHFDTALLNLYKDSDTVIAISKIENNQSAVMDVMNHLQEVPVGLEMCHDTVNKLYDAYKSITELSLAPTGSFTEYGASKNNAMSEFSAQYKALEEQMPEKKIIK